MVFQFFDILSDKVGFRVKGSEIYRTDFGGIISVAFMAASLGVIALLAIPFIKRSSPSSVIVQDLKTLAPEDINLRNSSFYLAFDISFFDENYTFIPKEEINQDLDIDFTYVQTTPTDYTETLLETTPCDIMKQNLNNSKWFFDTLPEGYFCFDTEKYSNISLIGTSSGNPSFITISVNLKSSKNQTYLDYIEKKYFKSTIGTINLYFSDLQIKINDLETPLIQMLGSYGVLFDFVNSKNVALEFSMPKVITDISYLFENNTEVISFPTLKNAIMGTSVRGPHYNDKRLIQYSILNSPSSTSYFRYYITISQYLANIGGILNVMLYILTIFNKFISKYNYEMNLMTHIFNFEEIKEKTSFQVDNSSNHKLIDINNSNDLRIPNQVINIPQKVKQNFLKQHSVKVFEKISEGEVFTLKDKAIVIFGCCKGNNKKKLYAKGSQLLNYYIDFFSVVKKISEIDIIKYLVFERKELQLVKFMKKPVVKVSQSSNKIDYGIARNAMISSGLKNEEFSSLEKNEKLEILAIFNEMKNKINKSDIEQRIIAGIDDRIATNNMVML
jgi:hypothetical protein